MAIASTALPGTPGVGERLAASPRRAPPCGPRGSASRNRDRPCCGAAGTPPTPDPIRPRALSTIETRTERVPKSTPATMDIEGPSALTRRRDAETQRKRMRTAFSRLRVSASIGRLSICANASPNRDTWCSLRTPPTPSRSGSRRRGARSRFRRCSAAGPAAAGSPPRPRRRRSAADRR